MAFGGGSFWTKGSFFSASSPITDILTKVYGSTNPLNVVKATMAALACLRDRSEIESLRGVNVE